LTPGNATIIKYQRGQATISAASFAIEPECHSAFAPEALTMDS
jgi:hypothetical protein